MILFGLGMSRANQTTQRTAAPRWLSKLAGKFDRRIGCRRALPGGCRWSWRSARIWP